LDKKGHGYGPTIRLAIISLVLCGLAFPLLVTGFAQFLFPYQANGELIRLNGRIVGSALIAQNFSSPMFFHSRNQSDSASGVDPDITLQDAYSQISRIHATTGIPSDVLHHIVDENVERTIWIVGEPYVNVLRLNLILIDNYPVIYKSYY
jgi:K+-transporting ATPase ATPase C chain